MVEMIEYDGEGWGKWIMMQNEGKKMKKGRP